MIDEVDLASFRRNVFPAFIYNAKSNSETQEQLQVKMGILCTELSTS